MENNPVPAPISTGPDQAEARLWNMLSHMIALTGLLTFVGFILGPLLVWMIQREKYPSVDQHGKESLNFQLSVLIYQIGLLAAGGVVGFLTCGIGWWLAGILCMLLLAAHLILVIIASAQAWSGGFYRYPYILRLIQ
jgi:uncharacterized Tic20 family protein